MNAYEDIVFRLRHCPDTVTAAEAADAIEKLMRERDAAYFRLCDWCGVCPEDKRNVADCEIAGIGEEYNGNLH